MALTYTPITELQAVNVMLSIIGEQPINTFAGTTYSEALLARTQLHNSSRAIQTEGLACNSEEHYTLNPTIDGYYMVPNDALDINPTEVGLDVVWRGTRLYDRYNHTYVFTTSSMDVDIIFFLPFESLPEAARYYICIAAARRFAEDTIGSTDIVNFTEDDEHKALTALMRVESKSDDRTLLDNPEIFRAVNRRF